MQHRPRTSLLAARPLALALATFAAAGCQTEQPTDDEPTAAAAQAATTRCADLGGVAHCPLGAAKLATGADGALTVSGLASATADGVSIALPSVGSYRPTGEIYGRPSRTGAPSTGVTVHGAAMDHGRVISTVRVERTPTSYLVSAAFSGTDAGLYRVVLYRDGEQVGTMAPRLSNGPGTDLPLEDPMDAWFDLMHWLDFFNGLHSGSCTWGVGFAVGEHIRVIDDGGRPVVADRVELEEVVTPGGGGYPYLTFDRIDFTSDAARMVLASESFERTR